MRAAPTGAVRDTVGDAPFAGWYRALDHRAVQVGTETWILEVLAIHADGSELWIQIANVDVPQQELVLNVSIWTTVAQVLAAMARWQGGAGCHPRVISVLPTH